MIFGEVDDRADGFVELSEFLAFFAIVSENLPPTAIKAALSNLHSKAIMMAKRRATTAIDETSTVQRLKAELVSMAYNNLSSKGELSVDELDVVDSVFDRPIKQVYCSK